MSELKATVIIDNITKNVLAKEWGLAVYIEYKDKKILLDTGASDKFIDNARVLGIDLSKVDYGVLSHAHFDHSDGMDAFFDVNPKADFYLRDKAQENCYSKYFIFSKYIGIKKGMLEKYKERIKFVEGDYEMCDGVYLIPHKVKGLGSIGKSLHMYRKENGNWIADDFAHEQSLVFETSKGLVIFNSCSHGGAYNIVDEVRKTFDGKPVYAVIGGFHLYTYKSDKVKEFAQKVDDIGVQKAITGHCTGDKAYDVLKRELGDKVEQLHSGYVFEI